MSQTIRLTKIAKLLILDKVTRSDVRLFQAGRKIVGLSEHELALKLGTNVGVVVALGTIGYKSDFGTWERALRYLLSRGIAHSALLRAVRGLLGKTQAELSHEAEIAAGTYRKFETSDLRFEEAINASGSLGKLLSYLVSKGIQITFSELNGAGVALKGLLLVDDLPGIQLERLNRPFAPSEGLKTEVAERS